MTKITGRNRTPIIKEQKYPKLTDKQDRRRKLMYKDIADIVQAYKQALPFPTRKEVARARRRGYELQSENQWLNEIAEMYDCKNSRIYVITRPKEWQEIMQARKRMAQAEYHKRINLGGNHALDCPVCVDADWYNERYSRGGAEMTEWNRQRAYTPDGTPKRLRWKSYQENKGHKARK